MKHRILTFLGAAVVIYLVVYGVLSALGEYSTRLYVTRHRYKFGLGIPTSQIWEPLFVKYTPWERNLPGWLFAPCVWLDRRVWHREIDILEFFRKNRDADGTRSVEGEATE
ncbi:MAG: hypothetical protein IKQ55_11005 [Kiritimatiellae bacterium]|nr:hypothetical protein [Kiritimatiellia bacterium]